jgi:Trk K+ transport system NAD-binding subunit
VGAVSFLRVRPAHENSVGTRLLPRSGDASLTDEYGIREYLTGVVVTPGSPLAGEQIRSLGLGSMGLSVLAVHRGPETIYPGGDTVLLEGDLMVVKTRREGLQEVRRTRGIEIVPDLQLSDEDLAGGSVRIVEAIVMAQSLVLGRTLRDLDFRHRFGLTVIAIHRLQGPEESFGALAGNDLWVFDATEHRPAHPRQRLVAIGLFVAAVAAAGLGVVPLAIAFLLAALWPSSSS